MSARSHLVAAKFANLSLASRERTLTDEDRPDKGKEWIWVEPNVVPDIDFGSC
jgi:hypothetical protein